MQQDVGSDVVGKIADHAHLFGSLHKSGTRGAGLGAEQGRKVDG